MEIEYMDDTHKKPKGAGKSSFDLIDSERLMDMLPVKPGSVVLDLACGRGNYSIFLSKIVGDQGFIYAADLWEEGIALLGEQIKNKGITNIRTLVADATQEIPLDRHSVDICLMATVLHDFEEVNKAGAVLKQIKTLLKPGGCLAVVEFKKIEGPPGPPVKIRMSEDEVEKRVTGGGFKKEKTADIGEYNYSMTFLSN